MGKQYYFLAGLHRSGNTVLSAILNQNPKIYVSPISPLPEYMWRCNLQDYEDAIINPRKKSAKYMISNMIKNYYEDIDKPVIFDRSKAWTNPDNVDMIKDYIDDQPKIIFTIRPLTEIIVSMININKNGLLKDMNLNNYNFNKSMSINDNIAEHLLNGTMYMTSQFATMSLLDPEKVKFIYLVKYEDIVSNPEETLNGIYSFLNETTYQHDFENIERKEFELDIDAGLSSDLHKIRKKISPSILNPHSFLSEEMIDRCNSKDQFYS